MIRDWIWTSTLPRITKRRLARQRKARRGRKVELLPRVRARRKLPTSPFDDHRGTAGESSAFGAVDGQTGLGQRVGRDDAAQAQGIFRSIFGNLLQKRIFGRSMSHVTVSADAPAQITQYPA